MNVGDYLNRLIPHRLDALAIAALMLELRARWQEPRPMEIFVDGKKQFQGLTSMFANPILEVSLINIRGVMEFVGLKCFAGALVQITPGQRRPDDIGIEMFGNASGPLRLVTPEDVGTAHPEDPEAAKSAVAATIDAANKGLAHFTEAYPDNPVDARQVLLACKVCQLVVERHLYLPLGAMRPPLPVEALRSDA